MNPELVHRSPDDARARHFAGVAARRNAEANDAMDFLFLGDEDGRHAEKCIHAVPCSRTYDPMPYPEAEPHDSRMYEGTGLGALYGLGDERALAMADEEGDLIIVTRSLVTELAGWNLTREGSL